jgi:hypothetical protein
MKGIDLLKSYRHTHLKNFYFLKCTEFKMKLKNILALCTAASFSLMSASNLSAAETVAEVKEAVNTAKDLATIGLPNGLIVTFKTEEDGIVYEESGNSEIVGKLSEASMLERFLALTDDDVAVPKDLIDIETDRELLKRARSRGVITKHTGVITPEWVDFDRISLAAGEQIAYASSWCSGSASFYDTDAYGQFYRTYKNHSWGIAGTTVYSSWKIGANKAKTINLYLVNCSSTNKLDAVTSYKNVFGNYKKQDSVKVNPSASRFWSKTYLSKRYRRVFVSGFGSGRFGGYVLFKDY